MDLARFDLNLLRVFDAVMAEGSLTRAADALAMTQQGLSLILAGHTNTERGYLPLLASRLNEALPGAQFIVSKTDRDPVLPL